MAFRMVDRDRGYRDLMRRAEALTHGSVVKVGVQGAKADADHGEGKTVAEVAAIHEYGLGNNPERSFIRATVDEYQQEILQNLRTVGKGFLKSADDVRNGLNRFGLWFVGRIQQRISDGIPPALKQSTIDRKGSSTPLIDKGQLRASITHKVEAGRSGGAE